MNRPDELNERIITKLRKVTNAPHVNLAGKLFDELNLVSILNTGKPVSYKQITDALEKAVQEAAK